MSISIREPDITRIELPGLGKMVGGDVQGISPFLGLFSHFVKNGG